MENRILFDWFEFSSTIDTVESLALAMGLDLSKFTESSPGRGYRKGITFNHISFFWDYYGYNLENSKDTDGNVCRVKVEMTGDGCRSFETYGNGDWYSLFSYISDNADTGNISVSRIDIAYDDFEGLLDMDKIFDDTINKRFVSKFSSKRHMSDFFGAIGSDGEISYTVYHGRKASDTCIRIYDKLLEQQSKEVDTMPDIGHWVRCEIELRHKRALRFVQLLCPSDFDIANGEVAIPIDELYFMTINNYLRYIEPSDTDSNKWRAPLAEHWARFCNSVTEFRISLWVTPGVDYTVNHLRNFIENRVGGAIYTYFHLFGAEFLADQIAPFANKLNPKYRVLLGYDTLDLHNECSGDE